MALAGLHNMSASRLCADSDRPSSQASSLLQMWRELEVENISSHPQLRFQGIPVQGRANELNADFSDTSLPGGSGHNNVYSSVDSNEVMNKCMSPRGLHNETDDNRSSSSESIDFSEAERERVREIFREWQNSGLRDHTTYDSHSNNYSRAQCLGEKECERVRVVREWIEMTTQQRGTYHGSREGQDADIGEQIERVREGLVVDNCENRARRTIRRLCGRQALLDLLIKAEKERKRELQDLLMHQCVSNFLYRNRIQSLLKGRFLRNKAYIQEEKHSTLPASELGILRQSQTVSGLREGFLSSNLGTSVRGPVGVTNTSSPDDIGCHGNGQLQSNKSNEDVQTEFCCQPDPISEETDTSVSYTDDSESDVGDRSDQQESASQVDEMHEVLVNDKREQLSSSIEFIERGDYDRENVVESLWRRSEDVDRTHETLGIEGSGQGSFLEPQQSFSQEYDTCGDERYVHGASEEIDELEGTTVEDLNWQNMSLELDDWQESVTENGDIDWVQLNDNGYNTWRDGSESIDVNSRYSSHQEYHVLSHNDDREHHHVDATREEEWHDNALTEATNNWSDEPSGEEIAPVDRIDSSYFSADDNEQNLELRGLQSRRRVSNLLRSDFRESLEQLIQSYVERQGHTSADSELDGTSFSPSILLEEEQEHQIPDLPVGELEAARSTEVILPSQQLTPLQTTWGQDFPITNRQQPQNHQNSLLEWEIINELRTDMVRLHQRMNSMQQMLEACMDMQLELQRAVRQEVSAALNRQSGSEEACKGNLVMDESKWDHVKKGVCCICLDANIDSLLYRCGHMCTCTKCAENLVQCTGKCPMCRAPVIEVIRAYSIH